eukprot:scaffold481611_cov63-Attheya_sp.AAC.1
MKLKRCGSSGYYWWCFVVLLVAPWVEVVWGMMVTTTPATSKTSSSDSSLSRRGFGLQVTVWGGGFVSSVAAVPTRAAFAAETVGKDPNCNDPQCLGVWDGLLADCPHSSSSILKIGTRTASSCVSSQDDTPGIFAEPWDYADSSSNSNDWTEQMRLLVAAIQLVSSKRGDQATVVLQEG